ncbi:MAG: hypothetical protein AAFY91_10855, partial [Bacteroidota bacterium]
MAHDTITEISIGSESMTAKLFGADMLRFRRTDNFELAAEEASVGRVRWPGEGIVDPLPSGTGNPDDDRWINTYGSNGLPSEYVYDLSHDNVIDTIGFPRDGLREALDYAVRTDIAFSMLVPEERYILVDLESLDAEYVFTVDFNQVESDLTIFLDRLLSGHFGMVPDDFTLQLGQEYYTGPLAETVSAKGLDHQGRMEATGALYNFTASFIKSYIEEKTVRGENPSNIAIDISVQIGRFMREPSDEPAFGSSDDMAIIANQFDDTGLAAVDELLFQRYVPRLEGVSQGLSDGPYAQSLSRALQVWSDRIKALGLSNEPEVTAGWAKSSYTRSEARADYPETVSNNAFQNRTDLDFESFYQSRLDDRHDLGERLPSMMLEFLDELIAAGVDNGFYYGFDTQFIGALSQTDTNGSSVTLLVGTFFSWLAEEAVGKVRVDHNLSATRTADTANSYIFAGEEEVSVFIAANEATSSGGFSHT